MSKLTIAITLIVSSLSAMGGHETGNGGDAVICRENGTIRSAELLDFYEARIMRGIELENKSDSVEEIIQRNFEKLDSYSPQNRKYFEEKFLTFFNETLFLSNVSLTDIPDSYHIIIPANCQIEQVAIQQDPKFPGDKRYIINKDIYDKFDNFNKAGLIQHELIYGLALNEADSRSTRYANSIISSELFKRYSLTDFTGLISQTPLIDEVVFANLDMNVSGQYELALRIGEYGELGGRRNPTGERVYFNYDGYKFILGKHENELELRSNTEPGMGLINSEIDLSYSKYLEIERPLVNLIAQSKPTTTFSRSRISFHSTGEIKKLFILINPKDLKMIMKGTFAGREILLQESKKKNCLDCGDWFGIELELYPNGSIKKIFSGQFAEFPEFAYDTPHFKYLYGELNRASFKIPQVDQEIYGVSFSPSGEVLETWKH